MHTKTKINTHLKKRAKRNKIDLLLHKHWSSSNFVMAEGYRQYNWKLAVNLEFFKKSSFLSPICSVMEDFVFAVPQLQHCANTGSEKSKRMWRKRYCIKQVT